MFDAVFVRREASRWSARAVRGDAVVVAFIGAERIRAPTVIAEGSLPGEWM